MTPEEFERIKEAEKEHLRKLKKLKEAHRQLKRQDKVTKAITDMTSSVQEKFDLHTDMMDQIAIESALNEARLEIALEASEQADVKEQAMRDENDLAKVKAKNRIRQMKIQSDGSDASKIEKAESATTTPSTRSLGRTASTDKKKESSQSSEEESKHDLPEKTIGRMKP